MGVKFRLVAGTVAVVCTTSWSLNKNQSVEFGQDLNRNASTDADAAFHNPAGVAFLPADGLYLGGGNQIILQDRGIQEANPVLQAYDHSDYQGKIRVWVFPTVNAAYRMNDLTLFAHGGPLSGGGEGVYDQGLPKFDNMILAFSSGIGSVVKATVDTGYQRQLASNGIPGVHVTNGAAATGYQRDLSFTGNEMTLGTTWGAAYKVLPTLSVSAAYRFSYARNAYKGTASKLKVAYQGSQGAAPAGISGGSIDTVLTAQTNHVIDSLWRDIDVDVVETGMAHSVIVGADFKPDDIWNIGVRFEWNGEMQLENKTSALTAPAALLPYLAAYSDGTKSKITEPMILAGGVSWKGVRNLTLESSWTYGFAEDVDRDTAQYHYHNSLFGGLGARYQITPEIESSVGYAYDWAYKNDAARDEIDPDLPMHYLTAGCGFQATPRLLVNAGVMVGIAKDQHATSTASMLPQTMSSSHLSLALGLQWRPQI